MKRTKILCAVTSVLMAVLLVALSVSIPIGALDTVTTSNKNKIDSVLREKMAEASDNEKIPVAIWYSDVDQDNIDKLTAQKVGFTREDVAVAYEMPSTELLASLEKEEAGATDEMQAYLKRTESLRKLERERTDEYIMTRREFSRSKYNEKSAKLIKDVDIKSEDITFQSQYAPMILAELTASEIDSMVSNSAIENIYYFEETEPILEAPDMDAEMQAARVDWVQDCPLLLLTGNNVKVGIYENERPRLTIDDPPGYITPMYTTPTTRIVDNVTLTDYGNYVVMGDTPCNPSKKHVDNVAFIITSIASGVTLYCSWGRLQYFETMISDGVQIMNISFGWPVTNNEEYAYTLLEKWYDHISAMHNVLVVKSAGNNGTHSAYDPTIGEPGPRVTSPGMAFNVLTVGSYFNPLDTNTLTEDTYVEGSSYKNSLPELNIYGCEKPDVIAPQAIYKDGAGTSYAAPYIVGCVALMYELKPSLSNYPHLAKAIVMASCNRKVASPTQNVPTETISQGITDRQGAGAADAWTMMCIVSRGTYGFGVLNGTERNIDILQPKYSSGNMNITLTWLKENTISDDHLDDEDDDDDNVAEGPFVNLDMEIYNNNSLVKDSRLGVSSTEMCYVPLSSTDFRYRVKILQNNTLTAVRYAYAWSVDDMFFTQEYDENIYYLANNSSDRYLQYNSSTNTASMRSSVNQTVLGNEHSWIIKNLGNNNCSIVPSLASIGLGLSTNTSNSVVINNTPVTVRMQSNSDGTVSFINEQTSKILSASGSTPAWAAYSGTPTSSQKWRLSKVNYRHGDVDLNGTLNIKDVTSVQKIEAELIIPENHIQVLLADVDANGVININDVTKIQKIINQMIFW